MRKYTCGPCPNRGRDPPLEWCWGCYSNLRGRTSYKDHRKCFTSNTFTRTEGHLLMKRTSTSQVSVKGQWACPDPAFLKAYPFLAAGLCDIWWDDNKPRVPWTMTIRFEQDAVHVCINDKEKNQGAYTTGETLPSTLALVEKALKDEQLAFRKWRK